MKSTISFATILAVLLVSVLSAQSDEGHISAYGPKPTAPISLKVDYQPTMLKLEANSDQSIDGISFFIHFNDGLVMRKDVPRNRLDRNPVRYNLELGPNNPKPVYVTTAAYTHQYTTGVAVQ